ncbi:MAG TPA: 2-hydroxyacid dehydrogenase [Acidimicrobiales bacterium]|nr:2-hydroxyacid dehydrogenase [Acidimicrobiales bacterium]
MRVAVFSAKEYDEEFLRAANDGHGHRLLFLEPRLTVGTAPLSTGCEAVCAFVNDDLGPDVLDALADLGARLVALRSAGANHVDLETADRRGLTVTRVPDYSPHAVAEHCAGLVLALNRKIHRAYNRIRENNFALNGLLGFDLHGKTVGVVGTGKIGTCFARIMVGFGCRVVASDPRPNDDCRRMGVEYTSVDSVLSDADIVALHCPLTAETRHLIDRERLARMKDGVMLVNTSRGALVDTAAAIDALKTGKIGQLGLDVYEEESAIFFEDRSDEVVADDLLSRLLTFPNVLVTGHQGFFTKEALEGIARTTIENITAFERGDGTLHRVTADA